MSRDCHHILYRLQAVQLLPHCWRWLSRRTIGELLSAWNSDLLTHVLMCVHSLQQCKSLMHAFCINLLTDGARSCNQTCLDSSDSQWQWGYWSSYKWWALKLTMYRQAVHKIFLRHKGGSTEQTPSTPSAYRPVVTVNCCRCTVVYILITGRNQSGEKII